LNSIPQFRHSASTSEKLLLKRGIISMIHNTHSSFEVLLLSFNYSVLASSITAVLKTVTVLHNIRSLQYVHWRSLPTWFDSSESLCNGQESIGKLLPSFTRISLFSILHPYLHLSVLYSSHSSQRQFCVLSSISRMSALEAVPIQASAIIPFAFATFQHP